MAKQKRNAVKEPPATYTRHTEIPTFFGKPMLRGTVAEIDPGVLNSNAPTLFYSHPNGEIWVGDAIFSCS